MPTSFRTATNKDAALIVQLLRESAIEQGIENEFFTTEADILRDIFGPTPKANVIIVEQNGDTAGLAVFFYNFASFDGYSGVYMEDIYVRPVFQGHGIGSAIFTYLAKHAVEQGCGLLEWLVLDNNEKANHFYRTMGSTPMHGWTVNRIKGDALKKLAEKA